MACRRWSGPCKDLVEEFLQVIIEWSPHADAAGGPRGPLSKSFIEWVI